MPLTYTDPISTYSDAVLTALEKEHVRNIIGLEALSELDTPISELTADQRRATRYDIDQWFNEVGEGTVRLEGASDGVNFSVVRDRNAIRRRVALRLGFPINTSGIYRIPITSGYSDSCDW